jgi:hypothetical protein
VASGQVSLDQAGEIVRTAVEVPGSEAALLTVARSSGLSKVRDEARKQRTKAIPAEGCDRRYGLEWDHDKPVANGGETSYENLNPKCGPHHWDKTERDRRAGWHRGRKGRAAAAAAAAGMRSAGRETGAGDRTAHWAALGVATEGLVHRQSELIGQRGEPGKHVPASSPTSSASHAMVAGTPRDESRSP